MVVLPPPHVLEAFRATQPTERLPGGQGEAFAAGDVVLKPASREAEASWVAGLFSTLEGPGFRVPRPIRARDGAWVHDGWTAWDRIDARPARPNGGRWPETLAACEAFHRALATIPRPAFLDARTDPWSVADRITWDEQQPPPLREVAEAYARLRSAFRPLQLPSQLVHGDFTANVLFAADQPPCVIDFSPYWRPAAFATAVIVVDALTWGGADASILDLVPQIPHIHQLLLRAELRRLLEVELHDQASDRLRPGEVAAHLPTIDLLLHAARDHESATLRTCPRCSTPFPIGHICPTCYDSSP